MTCKPRNIRQFQGHPGPRHHIPGSILVDFLLLFISSPVDIKPMLDIPLCKQPSGKVCSFSILSNRAVHPPDMEPDHFSPEQDTAEVYRTRKQLRGAQNNSTKLMVTPVTIYTRLPRSRCDCRASPVCDMSQLVDSEKKNAPAQSAITVSPWTDQHTSSQGHYPGKDPRTQPLDRPAYTKPRTPSSEKPRMKLRKESIDMPRTGQLEERSSARRRHLERTEDAATCSKEE